MASNFTPQQIEEFLQEFFDVVGARQYVGARYVPIFGRAGEDTVEWDDLAPYEPLTVVMHDGVSYVSRRYVPAGIDITDTDYWVQTYRFNAQVEQYRQEVLGFDSRITANTENIDSLDTDVDTLENNVSTMNAQFTQDINSINAIIESLIIESGTSDAEVIAARTASKSGRTYSSLARRLNSESFSYIRDIASSDDMNDLTDVGWYYVGDGMSNIANFPITTSEIGYVFCGGKTSPSVDTGVTPFQLYVSCRDVPQLYMRQASGSPIQWGAWKRISNSVLFLGQTDGNAAATDADILQETGFWLVNNADDPTHTAHLPHHTGVLVVLKPLTSINDTQCYQIFLSSDTNTDMLYIRRKAGSPATWQQWSNVSMRREIIQARTATKNARTYSSLERRLNIESVSYVRDLDEGDDLNNANLNGWYYVPDGITTLVNFPIATSEIGYVLTLGKASMTVDTAVIPFQLYVSCRDAPQFYMRQASGVPVQWGAWKRISNATLFMGQTNGNASATDADNMLETGFWLINNSANPTHTAHVPYHTGMLIVLKSNTSATDPVCWQVFMSDTAMYVRRRWYSPIRWSDWERIDNVPAIPEHISEAQPTLTAYSATGTRLKVMSYNVCQYDNDTTTDIDNDQLLNLRYLIMNAECDLMGWQESTATINDNGDNDKLAVDYVFRPLYAHNVITGQSLHAKTAFTSTPTSHQLQSGRTYLHGTITIDSKLISLYSVHPYPGVTAQAKALREQDWRELAGIFASDTVDYIIVFGDFNTELDELTLFESIFADYNMANGGYLGWFTTTGRYRAQPQYGHEFPNDNILVSSNIEIQKVTLYRDWYELLCSDHIPICADLVLTV